MTRAAHWTSLRRDEKTKGKKKKERLKVREKLRSRKRIIFAPLATLLQGRLSRKICRSDAQFTRILAYVHPGDVGSGERCRRSIKGATPPGDFPQRNEDTFFPRFAGRIFHEQRKNVLSLRDDASSGDLLLPCWRRLAKIFRIARIIYGNSFADVT